MAIEVKRKKDDDETKVAPMMDESFRKASLSSISLEERRKFESNLLRYGVLQNKVNPGEVEIGSPLVIPPYGPRTTETGEVRFMELDANGSNYVGLRAPDQCNGDNVWTLPGQDGASGMAMLTDGNHRLYFGWSGFWEKFGSNIGYTQGHISVNTTPNDDDGIIVKGGIYAFDDDESVYLKLVNKSDTAYDPVVQYAVGVDPVIRWTHGLDDSLSNDWLLCAGDALTDTASDEVYELDITYDAYIIVCDTGNHRIKKHLAADGSYSAEIGSLGSGDDQFNKPYGICSDGTYFYVADRANNRIKKHLLSTMAYDSKIGTTGSGDTNFNVPYDICTDGTYLYVVDQNNNRVKKHLCSDLSYVAETPSSGLNSPDVCCTDGTYLYVAQTSGATYRLFQYLCDDMSLVLRAIPTGNDGHIDSANIMGMCYWDGYLYLVNANNGDPQVEVFKYSASTLDWVSDHINVAFGSGVGQLSSPYKISTNGTYLWIAGAGNDRISLFTLAGVYSSSFGTYGIGDDNFNGPIAACLSGTISKETVTPGRAPILRAKVDGTALETYVSFKARNDIRFLENSVGNANYIAVRAPASVTSYSLVLPGTDSTGTQALVSNGSGTLSWSSMAHNVLSASHSDSLTGTVVKGDIIYGNATPKWERLAANATATKMFLSETSSVPGWETVDQADVVGLTTADSPTFAAINVAGGGDTPVFTIGGSGAVHGIEYYDGAFYFWDDAGAAADIYTRNINVVASGNPYIYHFDGTYVGYYEIYDSALRVMFNDKVGWSVATDGKITFPYQMVSTLAIGTAPLDITSTTVCTNLNADLLDGLHSTSFIPRVISATAAPTVNDDITNYLEGTVWIEQDADKAYVLVDNADGAAVWTEIGAGGGAGAFTDLSDAPANYTGSASKFVKVKADESGLEFVASSVAGHDLGSATHTDVNAAAPNDDDILRYDTGTSKWVAEALPAAANHDLLSATHADSTASAVSRGSIIIGDDTPKWVELPVGPAGQVLTSDGTDVAWAAPAGGGAPTDATYIVQTANGSLSAEQALGALATGILKNTTTTGVLSIANPSVDYSKHCWMRETFDGLNTATIIGQGSYFETGAWIDDGLAAGSTAEVTVKSGADKMLTLTNVAAAGATNSAIAAVFTTAIGANGGGRIHFKFKCNQDSANYGARVVIGDGTNQPFNIYFRYSTTWQIAFWNGSGVKIQNASKDTWYTIDATWGATGNTAGPVTVFIDGAWAYKGTLGTYSTKWDRVQISAYSPAGGSDCVLDVDDLYIYSQMPLGLD